MLPLQKHDPAKAFWSEFKIHEECNEMWRACDQPTKLFATAKTHKSERLGDNTAENVT